jgi:hypothetical protein
MPTLSLDAPIAESKPKRTKLETAGLVFMGLIVLALLGSVASTAFNWLAPSFLLH